MKRVLIVEDALELGRLLQAALATLDTSLQISLMPSAEEALLEAAQPVDLLVADIRLPGISGFELIKKLRARHPSVKVIVITGLKEPGLEEQAGELAVEAFFRKPLQMHELLEEAGKCLQIAPGRQTFVASGGQSAELPVGRLSEILAGLRRNLGALGALLLDDLGRVAVLAGDLPASDFEKEWVSPLMAAISAGARVSRLLGRPLPENILAFRGQSFDLALAPVGSFALVLAWKSGRNTLRLALAVEEILTVQKDLAAILGQMGLKSPWTPAPLRAPTAETEDEEGEPPAAQAERPQEALEALLAGAAQEIGPEEADTFWETAAASASSIQAEADMLDYEQAQKLGLAPGEQEQD